MHSAQYHNYINVICIRDDQLQTTFTRHPGSLWVSAIHRAPPASQSIYYMSAEYTEHPLRSRVFTTISGIHREPLALQNIHYNQRNTRSILYSPEYSLDPQTDQLGLSCGNKSSNQTVRFCVSQYIQYHRKKGVERYTLGKTIDNTFKI